MKINILKNGVKNGNFKLRLSLLQKPQKRIKKQTLSVGKSNLKMFKFTLKFMHRRK